jgi:plasmid stability protein
MPINLTIRNVPDALARTLKLRAERNHRSLQGEVMAILEGAAVGSRAEEPATSYGTSSGMKVSVNDAEHNATKKSATSAPEALTIQQLWERGRRHGLSSPDESTLIVRKLRDKRGNRDGRNERRGR